MGDSLASSDDHNRTAQPRAVRDVLADVRDQVIRAFTGPGPDGGRFERRARRSNAGHPWLVGPAYGFGAETGLHALRLTGSGLFDAFPKLTIILGHLGEGLPFNLFRIDERIRWSPLGYPAKKQISQYFAENFCMTTRVISAPKRW